MKRRSLSASSALAICLVAIFPLFVDLVARGSQPLDSVVRAQNRWKNAAADYPWKFPDDHWSHDEYQSEWWYFTGHLQTSDHPPRRFGFQFTFFRFGLAPTLPPRDSTWNSKNLIMAHLAISDIASGEHLFSEVLTRESPLLAGLGIQPDSLLAWSRAPAGSPGRWLLHWNGNGFRMTAHDSTQGLALQLSTRPLKPVVLQGPNGYSRKSPLDGHASLYYSFPRMHTTGTLVVHGRRFAVQGLTWMDKEFGSGQLAENQTGWDWLSVQLLDGREWMGFLVRDTAGNVDHASAALISVEGKRQELSAGEWTWSHSRTWQSPHTKATYPIAWRLRVPGAGLDLSIEALIEDQENRGRRLFYWEGAVQARNAAGELVGHGYVEMTGYGKGNRPPL